MSYGVHVMNTLLKKALTMLDEFDLEMVERHHNKKGRCTKRHTRLAAGYEINARHNPRKYLQMVHSRPQMSWSIVRTAFTTTIIYSRRDRKMENFTAEEIIQYISNAHKVTPVKVYVNGNFEGVEFPDTLKVFGSENRLKWTEGTLQFP